MLCAMRDDIDNQLAAIAAKQHRVFSWTQAAECGTTLTMRQDRLASGRWVEVCDGVFAFRGALPNWNGWAQAALIDAGPESMIGYGAAARVSRYPGYKHNGVEILVPRALDHRCDIAVVHESRRFDLIPTVTV